MEITANNIMLIVAILLSLSVLVGKLADTNNELQSLLTIVKAQILAPVPRDIISIRGKCDALRQQLSDATHQALPRIREADDSVLGALYVFVNMMQESQEIVAHLHKLLRADAKMYISPDTKIRNV